TVGVCAARRTAAVVAELAAAVGGALAALSVAARRAGAAAVDGGLIAVLLVVGAGRRHAQPRLAHAAQAVVRTEALDAPAAVVAQLSAVFAAARACVGLGEPAFPGRARPKAARGIQPGAVLG